MYQETIFFVGPDSNPLFQDQGQSVSPWHIYFALGQDLFPSLDHVSDTHGPQSSITCEPNQIIPGTTLRLKNNPLPFASPLDLVPAFPSISVTERDINRWNMALRAAERFHNRHSGLYNLNGPFRRHVPNLPKFEDILKEYPLALGFSAAAFIYGGLHALAWFAQFRSPTEQLLWRISSVAVMSGIPIMAIFKGSRTMSGTFDRLVRRITRSQFRFDKVGWMYAFARSPVTWLIAYGPLLLVAIAYILARLYLVVECFIQLSHLPAGVYEVPEWSTYFPHIA